jgi:hypothetical protein
MIILKEQTEPQELTFIPREMNASTIVLRNETTNEISTIQATFSLDSYYLTTTTVFDLKEFTFYNLTILDGADVVYKDKIFCTNQVLEDYTVNQNQYVQNDTNNEYKIYE